jgi:hypothetical protein
VVTPVVAKYHELRMVKSLRESKSRSTSRAVWPHTGAGCLFVCLFTWEWDELAAFSTRVAQAKTVTDSFTCEVKMSFYRQLRKIFVE